MDGMRAADGQRADLGEADRADVSRLYEMGDRTDGVLDGDGGVAPRGAVDIDMVHAKAFQGVGEKVPDGGGPGVVTGPASIGTAHGTELDGNQRPVAAAAERLAKEHFVVPH